MKIKGRLSETGPIYSIPIASLTNFEWDELYIVTGPRFPIEVEEIIGVDYKEVIEDNSYQYIFIEGNKIVKELSSYCGDLSYSDKLTKGKGFVKYLNSSSISIQKKKNDGQVNYWIVEPRQFP